MAKTDQPETTPGTLAASGNEAAAPQIQQTIEPPDLEPIYTNFARVTGSPEELILDFGLNSQPIGNVNTPVKISERLVMNYFTAKRLWHTLGVSLQRHEQAFGVLETDIAKRVMPQSRSQR